MRSELAPPRQGNAPAAPSLRTFGIVAALALLAAVLFYRILLFGGALHGYDWKSHHYHYFDWVRMSLTHYDTLPLFMNDAWITKNFLANAEAPSLGPLVPLLLLLPTGAYIKLLVTVFAASGIVGMFFLLRDLDVGRAIAAFAALVFAFNGFFLAHVSVGHHWVLGAYLLPGILCLFRRAALGSRGALWGCAAANACTILGGQHQPFIWQNLLVALFAVFWALGARALFPVAAWLRIVAATAGLGAVKLLPMLAEFAAYAPTAKTGGLPLGLVVSSLTAHDQYAELVTPKVVYTHGSGWWEYAFFVGPIALVTLALGSLAARRCWPLVAIGLCFFVLAVEWPAPLRGLAPWPWLEDLPVWRTQRSPSRLLFLALFAFSVVGAVGLQRAWESRAHWPRAVPLLAAAMASLVCVDLLAEGRSWQRAALGEPLRSKDHRPRPLRLGEPGGATAELVEFAPNRLVYRVTAERRARIVFPFRYGKGTPEWRVDGLPAQDWGGKLALDVPPGERDIVMVYRPRFLYTGLVVSAASLLWLGVATGARRRGRGNSTDCAG